MNEKSTVRRVMVLVFLSSALAALGPSLARGQAPGTAWSAPLDVSLPQPDGDDLAPVLLCDDYQNMHLLWAKNHETGSAIYYRNDLTGEWSTPFDVVAVADPAMVRLSAAISRPNHTLHVIGQNSYIRGDVFYSSAPLAEAADTRAWERPRLVVSHADSAGITADSSGTLHLIYGASDADGYRNSVYHARSDDKGLSWSEPSLVYEVSSAVPSTIGGSASFDAAGRIHVGITIRSQEYGVYSEVGYIRSLDGGQTWQPYRAIATQSEATPNVSVIVPFVFGEDEVHLTWHDPRRMHMWSNDGGTTWSSPVQIIELGAGFGGANYLAKDSAGVLRAATGVKNGVFVSTFNGSQWVAPEQIENRSMDPHGQQLVVCQGNQLHVVYDDRVEEDTTVWYSHRQVDAPHLAQSPLPASERTAAANRAESTPAALPTPEPEQVVVNAGRRFDSSAPAETDASPLTPLLVATASVVALLIAVLVWPRTR
jgi:hypothetical protein